MILLFRAMKLESYTKIDQCVYLQYAYTTGILQYYYYSSILRLTITQSGNIL